MLIGTPPKELLLVGGGHAHVQVLRNLAMQPQKDIRATLVIDKSTAVYSGMIPGWVAGQYQRHDLEIDLWPLARQAQARIILAPALSLDSQRAQLEVEGRPPIAFDVASLDIGSTVAGLDLPGVRALALPSRPISGLLDRLEQGLSRLSNRPRIGVVGGGAAGIELVFCLKERLKKMGKEGEFFLIDSHTELLRGRSQALRKRVENAAQKRGISLLRGKIIAIEPSVLVLENGERLACDLPIWVPGAAAHAFAGDLPRDAQGYFAVAPNLRCQGVGHVFAAGDCAAFSPALPKAGVYAVRQGPVLCHNLLASLRGQPLQDYRPQSDFLALLNLGDGTALGDKWGIAIEGEWVWRLKDRIDRKFMAMFQLMGPDDAPLKPMPLMEGPCGGCAAKVSQEALAQALSALPPSPQDRAVVLGVEQNEDIAALRLSDQLYGWNLDAFVAPCEDPFLVGQLGALNALSDLHVKGVRPRFAMVLAGLPEKEPPETLKQLLWGARQVLDGEEVRVLGGHTLRTEQLLIGFSVMGAADQPLRLQAQAKAGDRLLLTRALGTGLLFRADMRAEARGIWMQNMLAQMLRAQGPTRVLLNLAGIQAATDVTGFGLAGHLLGMLKAAQVSAEISLSALPLLPGVPGLLARGIRSSFHPQNRRIAAQIQLPDDPLSEILFDPQTCGGILCCVPAEQADFLLDALRAAGESSAALIGRILPPKAGHWLTVRP